VDDEDVPDLRLLAELFDLALPPAAVPTTAET
jgi:hypothetical protein